MVRWTEHPTSCIIASSGGGIALDKGALGNYTAAALGSAPTGSGAGTQVGLELWLTDDPALLKPWTVQSEIKGCYGSTTKSGGVVCPSMVPSDLHAGYIGDNYMWQEGPVGNRTYYVLAGSTVCKDSQPWCGYPHGTLPMSMLFSSPDLLHWQFHSQYSNGQPNDGLAGDGRLDVPDTFPLSDGRQAFQWLTGGYSVWAIGNVSAGGVFTNQTEGSMDEGKFFCQQSFWTPDKRRVSIGWVQNNPSSQSFPREIVEVNNALHYRPAKELQTLNGAIAYSNRNLLLSSKAVHIAAGTQFRVTTTITCSSGGGGCAASLSVLGGAVAISVSSFDPHTKCKGKGSSATNAYGWCLQSGTHALPFGAPSSASALLDVFVDGGVIEVYAGDGARVLTLTTSSAVSDAVTLSGSEHAAADVQAWPLARPPPPVI